MIRKIFISQMIRKIEEVQESPLSNRLEIIVKMLLELNKKLMID